MLTRYDFILESVTRREAAGFGESDFVVRFRAAGDGLPVVLQVGLPASRVMEDDLVPAARRELHRLIGRLAETAAEEDQSEGLRMISSG